MTGGGITDMGVSLPLLGVPGLFDTGLSAYIKKLLALGDDGPVAYWPLSEKTGTVAADLSANGCDGTAVGITWGAGGIGDGTTAPTFDGVNDYIRPDVAILQSVFNGVAGTLAAWAHPTGLGDRTIVRLADISNNDVALRTSSAGFPFWEFRAGGTLTQIYRPSAVELDTWLHIAVTWDENAGANGEIRAFFNGAQYGTAQNYPATSWNATGMTRSMLGAYDNAGAIKLWLGRIAHVALWDIALTPAQIATLAVVD